MPPALKAFARNVANRMGYDVVRVPPKPAESHLPQDYDGAIAGIIRRVRPHTQTSVRRLHALCEAVKYVAVNRIPGDIVECGVWRGGSMMAAAMMLHECGDHKRTLHLFDNWAGNPRPSERDIRFEGPGILHEWERNQGADGVNAWGFAALEECRSNMQATGYAPSNIRYVQGDVKDTVPAEAPNLIALLRLDTAWYDSTEHELRHLYPRLARGGVLILDDYGYWKGVRAATDEYFREEGIPMLLHRIDDCGRIGVRQE